MPDRIKKKAAKMRAMTDEELVSYVENRVAKARSEGFNRGRKQRKQEEQNDSSITVFRVNPV